MKKLIFLILAIIMVLSMSLVGCGKTSTTPTITSKTTDTTTTTTSTSTTLAPPDKAIPGLPAAMYKPAGGTNGGRLQLQGGANIANIGDPSGSAGPSDAGYSFLCVEPLVIIDKNNAIQPWLAESYTIPTDKSSITLKLRQGINFTDGTPFNAEAAKYNIDTGINSLMWPNMKKVKECVIVDPYTIRLDFVAGKWDWVAVKSLAGFWSVQMFSPTYLKNHTAEEKMVNVVGTGPFILKSYVRDQKLVYDRNPNYWRGAPYLDGVDFNIITDATVALLAFKKGDLHYLGIQTQDAAGVQKDGFVLTETTDMVFNMCLLPSSGNPNSILTNIDLRRAVESAINKQELVDSFTYGYGKTTNQGFCLDPFRDNTTVGYPFDKAKVKQYLTTAGHPDGFTTTLYMTQGGNSDVPMAIKGQLAEVGITLNIETISYIQLVEMIGGGGTGWDGYIFMFGFPGTTTDPASTLANGPLNAIRDATTNAWTITTWISCEQPAELCDLAEQGAQETDSAKRIPIYQKISKLATDKYCQWSYMYYVPTLTSVSPKLKGATFGQYKEFLAYSFAYLTP
jgi:peptide/nickel transport system substrate-binding protein